MKPPVHVSIARVVLPAKFRGQQDAFGRALGEAVSRQIAGGPPAEPNGSVERAANRTSAAIAAKSAKGWRND